MRSGHGGMEATPPKPPVASMVTPAPPLGTARVAAGSVFPTIDRWRLTPSCEIRGRLITRAAREYTDAELRALPATERWNLKATGGEESEPIVTDTVVSPDCLHEGAIVETASGATYSLGRLSIPLAHDDEDDDEEEKSSFGQRRVASPTVQPTVATAALPLGTDARHVYAAQVECLPCTKSEAERARLYALTTRERPEELEDVLDDAAWAALVAACDEYAHAAEDTVLVVHRWAPLCLVPYAGCCVMFYCCNPRIEHGLRARRAALDRALRERVMPLAARGTTVKLDTNRKGGLERWYGAEMFNRALLCMPWVQCRCTRYYYRSRVVVERVVVLRPVDAVEIEAEASVVDVATQAAPPDTAPEALAMDRRAMMFCAPARGEEDEDVASCAA